MPRDEPTEKKLIFTQLKALKKVREDYVPEQDGRDYNALVQRLITLGYDAADFLIPEHDFYRPVSTRNQRGEATAHRAPIVRDGVFHRKLASLLEYFELSKDATVVDVSLPKGN